MKAYRQIVVLNSSLYRIRILVTLSLLLTPLFFPAMTSAAPVELLSESFSDCGDPNPVGWEVVNLGGDCNWMFDSDKDNETGGSGCFSLADSDACGLGTSVDTVLVTPSLDCSGMIGTTLSFQYDAYTDSDTPESIFILQVSTDGGITWVSKDWQPLDKNLLGPKNATVDISSEADGQSDVRIRFRYTASFDWWWQLDDVTVVASDEKSTFNWLLFLPAIIGRPTL